MRRHNLVSLLFLISASAETFAQGAASSAEAGSTSGQTTTEAQIALTPEQAAEIRQVIIDARVLPESGLTDAITLGDSVPQNVTLLPLPLRAIQLIPTFEGFLFFITSDGRIVVVSPTSLQAVLIL